MGQPTRATSPRVKSRLGLKLSASVPQRSGLRCLGQFATCTGVPRGSVTELPPGPTTSSLNWRRLKVPFGTAGHSRRVSVMQRSMNSSRDRSRYVGSRPPWSWKKRSTSRCRSCWSSGCLASSNSIQVMVWPVVSWPAKTMSSMLPKLAASGRSEVPTARDKGPQTGRSSVGRARDGSARARSMMACMAVVRDPTSAPPDSPWKVARIGALVASMKASGQPSNASCSWACASCRRKLFMSTGAPSFAEQARRSAQLRARSSDLGRISARVERGRKASCRCLR
mmetsp:Transcript_51906/g.116916  ORF Transcript_51906/g.116916 Transcript_51906/m.116916 type:complete len:282 (-) Transcript_51906:62-907(-)